MTRKPIVIAISLVIVLGLGLATQTVWSDNSDDAYLALGDSLAYGIGATDPATGGYVPRFADFLKDGEDIESLSNLSVPGETSDSMIGNGQLAAAVSAINNPDADVEIVTLDIGGNDFLGLLGAEPCATDPSGQACQAAVAAALGGFAGNYTIIVETLVAALDEDEINEVMFVMTYYNPFSGTGSPMEPLTEAALLGIDGVVDCSAVAVNPANSGLNDMITCIGESAGATVVDVKPQFDGNALALTHIATGDIHPNDAGYAVIADEFVQSFEDDDKDKDKKDKKEKKDRDD